MYGTTQENREKKRAGQEKKKAEKKTQEKNEGSFGKKQEITAASRLYQSE